MSIVDYRATPAAWRTRLTNRVLRASAHPTLRLAALGFRTPAFRWYHLSDHLFEPLRPPAGTRCRRVALTDCAAEWVTGPGVDSPRPGGGVVLYFHGGGFVVGGLRSHRRLVAQISRAARVPALHVDYRYLPRVPLQTSVADGVDAYRHLLSRGYGAEEIVVAGDSAGGFLAFAVALAVTEQGLSAPGGIVGLSPWLDLDCDAKAAWATVSRDPYMTLQAYTDVVGAMRDSDRRDRALSPVRARLSGLPPVFLQVGSTELVRPDVELMAERLAVHGIPCQVQIWDQQPHVFQAGAGLLPGAREAIAEIGGFIAATLTRRRARDTA